MTVTSARNDIISCHSMSAVVDIIRSRPIQKGSFVLQATPKPAAESYVLSSGNIMSLRNEETVEQLFQPIGDLSIYFDQRVRQILVPKSRIDELKGDAEERAELAAAAREAERVAREAKRAAEKKSKEAQAKIIADTARECAAAAQKARRRPRSARIFAAEQITIAENSLTGLPEDRCERLKPLLADIKRDDGYRRVPSLRGVDCKLRLLHERFANMSAAIDRLAAELALASAMPPDDFRVTPLLLLGEPGLGKTFFSQSLAQALGVDFDVVSAGGAQGGFVLAGTASHWSNTAPGGVAKLLARSTVASPVLVIDEVDKIAGDDRYPVLPALLDLLEPATARAFKDESLDMRIDASKLIVLLTANYIDLVPAPLLSRVEVLQVPRPNVAQRLLIVEGELAVLRKRTRRKIELAAGTARALAEREDLDLRKTTRIVRDAFANAMLRNQLVAMPEIPAEKAVISMGFAS